MNSDRPSPEEMNEAYEAYADYWTDFTFQVDQGDRPGNAKPVTFQQFLAGAK